MMRLELGISICLEGFVDLLALISWGPELEYLISKPFKNLSKKLETIRMEEKSTTQVASPELFGVPETTMLIEKFIKVFLQALS